MKDALANAYRPHPIARRTCLHPAVWRAQSGVWMRLLRAAGVLAASAALAACQPEVADPAPVVEPVDDVGAPLVGSLEWAAAGPWREPSEKARDADRNPIETLEFFRIEPSDVVIDAWPIDGWYAAILAPYLSKGGGRYVAALLEPLGGDPDMDAEIAAWRTAFAARFGDAPLFESVTVRPLGALAASPPGAPQAGADADAGAEAGAGSGADSGADAALAVRAVHAWMALGLAEIAFSDLYSALAPGGYLGVVEHRGLEDGVQDPRAASGYVQESYVRRLAEEAGFVFVAASDHNANPLDDADHPFGVWSLAPHRLTAPLGAPPNPDFDRSDLDAVGEPDRMTLLFRKPRS